MTRLNLSFFLVPALLAMNAAGQAAPARSVYVLPMTGGLDQYLADQITRDHVMQVVADPKLADVVMTDRLNESFGEMLAKLHPRTGEVATDATQRSFRSASNKGTLFLVDAKSRQVVWSDYEKPGRNTTDAQLNVKAGRIVKKLQSSFGITPGITAGK